MTVRPFTSRLSIGTDICRTSRIRKLICRENSIIKSPSIDFDRLHAFYRRVFTVPEARVLTQYVIGDDIETLNQIRRRGLSKVSVPCTEKLVNALAGRFAAKEAAIKAVSQRSLSFSDILIWTKHKPDFRSEPVGIILDHDSAAQVAWQGHLKPASWWDSVIRDPPVWKASLPHDPKRGLRIAGAPGSKSIIDISDLNGQLVRVSISHDGNYSTAVCLVEEDA